MCSPARLTLVCLFAATGICINSTAAQPTPEGNNGIASKYVGDRGIANAPDVVLVEDFAELNQVKRRWHEVSDKFDNLSLSRGVPPGSSSKHSLLITHIGGRGTGGSLFRRLDQNYEQLFARWFVKFDPDCAPIHHFGTHLGGYNPATRWPQPNAGIQPPGDRRFTTGVEPFGNRWKWDFYTY